MKLVVKGLVMMGAVALLACGGKTSKGAGDCSENADCESGQVCTGGICQTICGADNQCGMGEICADSVCLPGTRETPDIQTVDGDGAPDCPATPGTHCLYTGIVVAGSNLEGAAFELIDAGNAPQPLDRVAVGSDTLVSLYLPDVAAGSYTLRATNAAGSDQAALTLLQGAQGEPGQDGSPDTATEILIKLQSLDSGSGISGLNAGQVGGSSFSAIQAQIDQALAAAVPTGTVVPFAGPSASVPSGWLLCDGAELSRTGEAGLFAVVGITHGGGNGIDTFNLPDYRGRFLRGVDHAASRDPDSASRTVLDPVNTEPNRVGSVQGAAFASHAHSLYISGNTGATYGVTQGGTGAIAGPHARSTAVAGGSETRPINAYVNYIIKL